jgi:hypothetical protein
MSDTARTEAIVGFSLVALLLVAGSLTTEVVDPNPDLRASTFVNDRAGLRALYLLLEESGVSVTRRLAPIAADAPTDRTLVIAAPSDPVLETEVDDVLDWVDHGGRLVLLDQPAAPPLHPVYTEPLLSSIGLLAVPHHDVEGEQQQGTEGLSDRLPREYTGYAWKARKRLLRPDPAAAVEATQAADPRAGDVEWLVAPKDRPLAARVPFGANGGEVIVISDTRVLDNLNLRLADNALLAVDLLTGSAGRDASIEFDEFHHGFREDGERGNEVTAVIGVLKGSWPGRAVLLLVLAALLSVLARGVRFGAPDAEPRRRRRTLTEHTAALGDIFRAARCRDVALALLARGVRRVVGPRVGLSTHLPPAEFDRRLARSSAPGALELAQALAATESADLRGDGDFARRARALAEARRSFVHGHGRSTKPS